MKILHWNSGVDNGNTDKNMDLLRERRDARWLHTELLVGDYVIMPDGHEERVAHCMSDSAQTCAIDKASFYIWRDGRADMSGTLNPAHPVIRFRPIREERMGKFWFFHHDETGPHRGVYVELPVRVWRLSA